MYLRVRVHKVDGRPRRHPSTSAVRSKSTCTRGGNGPPPPGGSERRLVRPERPCREERRERGEAEEEPQLTGLKRRTSAIHWASAAADQDRGLWPTPLTAGIGPRNPRLGCVRREPNEQPSPGLKVAAQPRGARRRARQVGRPGVDFHSAVARPSVDGAAVPETSVGPAHCAIGDSGMRTAHRTSGRPTTELLPTSRAAYDRPGDAHLFPASSETGLSRRSSRPRIPSLRLSCSCC